MATIIPFPVRATVTEQCCLPGGETVAEFETRCEAMRQSKKRAKPQGNAEAVLLEYFRLLTKARKYDALLSVKALFADQHMKCE